MKRVMPSRSRHESSRTPADDAGFTLVELLVSLTIVGVVLSATMGFLVKAQATTRHATNRETASTVATAAIDLAQRLGAQGVKTAPYWNTTNEPADTEDGVDAVTSGGVRYERHWDTDDCHLPAPVGATNPDPGACTDGIGGSGDAPMVRVRVKVIWPCREAECALTAVTVLSAALTQPALT